MGQARGRIRHDVQADLAAGGERRTPGGVRRRIPPFPTVVVRPAALRRGRRLRNGSGSGCLPGLSRRRRSAGGFSGTLVGGGGVGELEADPGFDLGALGLEGLTMGQPGPQVVGDPTKYPLGTPGGARRGGVSYAFAGSEPEAASRRHRAAVCPPRQSIPPAFSERKGRGVAAAAVA